MQLCLTAATPNSCSGTYHSPPDLQRLAPRYVASGGMETAMRVRSLLGIFLALACGSALCQSAAPVPDTAVVAQDLQELRAAGKFDAVLWTRRTTLCTVQVVLARPEGASRMVSAGPAAPGPQPLDIEVWLLRADGSKIPATGRWRSANFNKHPPVIRSSAPEVLFGFPLSAAGEAVTAVMSVNGQTYIQHLQPFKDQIN